MAPSVGARGGDRALLRLRRGPVGTGLESVSVASGYANEQRLRRSEPSDLTPVRRLVEETIHGCSLVAEPFYLALGYQIVRRASIDVGAGEQLEYAEVAKRLSRA
jgi:hypothetical protein